jgi:hypothetical protein
VSETRLRIAQIQRLLKTALQYCQVQPEDHLGYFTRMYDVQFYALDQISRGVPNADLLAKATFNESFTEEELLRIASDC